MQVDKKGLNILHHAATAGIEVTNFLLDVLKDHSEQRIKLLGQQDRDGQTPILKSVYYTRRNVDGNEITKSMLDSFTPNEQEAKIECLIKENSTKTSPLSISLIFSKTDRMETILQSFGSNNNARLQYLSETDQKGRNILHQAVKKGRTKAITTLLKSFGERPQADNLRIQYLNKSDSKNRTPYHLAKENLELQDALLAGFGDNQEAKNRYLQRDPRRPYVEERVNNNETNDREERRSKRINERKSTSQQDTPSTSVQSASAQQPHIRIRKNQVAPSA